MMDDSTLTLFKDIYEKTHNGTRDMSKMQEKQVFESFEDSWPGIYAEYRKWKKEYENSAAAYLIKSKNLDKPAFYSLFDVNGEGKVKSTLRNVEIILENDPVLKDTIKYNTLALSEWVYEKLPWDQTKDREWTDTDDNNLWSYIETSYNISSRAKITAAVDIVAKRNQFNPVCEKLYEVYNAWIKEGRKEGYIRSLLPDYLGVEDNDYTYNVMKLTLLGAISRAFNPGCKFDFMPVLIGVQGKGKSTFCRKLSLCDDWYNDNLDTLDGDRAMEKLRGKWVNEIGELKAIKRQKDVETIKAFISSTSDVYRPAYARRSQSFPRGCIFIGTTNKWDFLTDPTGNRRFFPIDTRAEHIKKSIFDRMSDFDIQMAYGEAMQIFIDAECRPKLVLPEEIAEQAEASQKAHVQDDPKIGIIQEWLDQKAKEGLDTVCAAMIYEELLYPDVTKVMTRNESNDLNEIMTHRIEGWHKYEKNNGRKRMGRYGTQYCYVCDQSNTDYEDAPTEHPFNDGK